jgi:hypothetical protein
MLLRGTYPSAQSRRKRRNRQARRQPDAGFRAGYSQPSLTFAQPEANLLKMAKTYTFCERQRQLDRPAPFQLKGPTSKDAAVREP